MSARAGVILGILAGVFFLASDAAAQQQRVRHMSPRAVAKAYAQQKFQALGNVTVARRALFDTRHRENRRLAYGVTVNGQKLKQAVMVKQQGIGYGYNATGLADVHMVVPNGTRTENMRATANKAVIYRTRGGNPIISGERNLVPLGQGFARGKLSAAFKASFGLGGPTFAPIVTTTAKVATRSGQSTLNKTFHHRFIFDPQNPPVAPVQPSAE